MALDSFGTRDTLVVDETTYEIRRLDRVPGAARLPYSLKVLLENLLRNEDGRLVTAEQVERAGRLGPAGRARQRDRSSPRPGSCMQDFTGVPCVVDLVAMRDAMTALGGDPQRINPLIPAELVIDHSVIADVFGRPDAFQINAGLEFERNQERYQLLRWAQQAFDDFSVVPPGHRHLPPGQPRVPRPGRLHARHATAPLAYPDTLVGTDSHTPMVNGLGRARLGRRRHRGRGRHARPADEHARPAGPRPQADRRAAGRRDRHRPGAHRRRAAAPAPGWSASSSSSTAPAWPTCRWPTGPPSAT